MTFKGLIAECQPARKMDKLQTSFQWQRTQHEKQCLSLQDLRRSTPRPACSQADGSPRGRVVMVGGYLQAERRRVPSCSCSGFRHRGDGGDLDVNTVEGAQPCWVSRSWRDPALTRSWTGAFLTPACASCGAAPGGLTWRSCGHSLRTWMASLPCVCGNAWSVHPNGQTSRCSLPTCICRASLLEETKDTQTLGRHPFSVTTPASSAGCWESVVNGCSFGKVSVSKP